ncbi:MAG: hypothetical protein JW395_0450 [Nitrospira sp.]|nr:hypothetical protein [Nitrospira sp.]
MTTFDQYMLAAESVNDFGGAACVRERFDLDAGQLLSLMDVRGDEQRQGEELCFHGVDGFRLEQGMAGLRDHDRIHHEVHNLLRLQEFCDDLDDHRRGQHPGLHRSNVEVIEYGVDLRRND